MDLIFEVEVEGRRIWLSPSFILKSSSIKDGKDNDRYFFLT